MFRYLGFFFNRPFQNTLKAIMKPFMNEPQSTHPSTGSLYLYLQKADLKARRQSIYYELGELEKHSPVLKKKQINTCGASGEMKLKKKISAVNLNKDLGF